VRAAGGGGLPRRAMSLRHAEGLPGQTTGLRAELSERSEAMRKVTPCLWFDTQGEDAAEFYTAIFDNSRIVHVARYGSAGPRPAGSVMTVTFELDGQRFVALNGGPEFTFSEAISFQVDCASQEEVDHFWSRLGDGGQEGPCGWLKDRFGVSWQIVPARLNELLDDPDPETSERVMRAMLEMRKIDIATLEEAAAARV
jgi:predicted 3-demethylubiquinone-9 3-methyltransferase (glyoxalase superfamily)